MPVRISSAMAATPFPLNWEEEMMDDHRRSSASFGTMILKKVAALLVLLAACGCDRFQEYRRVQTEVRADKAAFLQENLPELRIVCDKLASQLQHQELRLKDRISTLRAIGRDPAQDPVCRRWRKLLANMQEDNKALDDAGTDAYLKHEEHRSAGTVDDRKIEALEQSLSKARKLAASTQRKTEYYEKQIAGKTEDDPGPPPIHKELSWPPVLAGHEYAAFRTELDNTFAELADVGRLSEERLAAAKQATKEMAEELRVHIKEVGSQEYIEAKQFILTLSHHLDAAQSTTSSPSPSP